MTMASERGFTLIEVLVALTIISIALMASLEFNRTAEQYGILSSFMAVGSLVGALIAARRWKAELARLEADKASES